MGLKILGIQVNFRNSERLKNPHPSIIIENHQHGIDLFIVCYTSLPKGTLSIGKRSLIWIPFFGWIYFLAGHFLIDRKNHGKAMKTMEKVKRKLKKGNISVFIMPEGTRSYEKGLGPFKAGAFHLALETQVKIQPIAVSSFSSHIKVNRWHAGTIWVEALAPIETSGKTIEDLEGLLSETRNTMLQAIKNLDKNPT